MKFEFLIVTIYISIYQNIIWLICWATYLIISGHWARSVLPQWVIVPWTLYLTTFFIIPSNIIGSIFANLIKWHINKLKKK
jgi:hypothetical protein